MVICDHTNLFLQSALILPILVEMLTVLLALLVQLMPCRVQPAKLDMDYLTMVVLHHASVSADGNGKFYADIYVNKNRSNALCYICQ